METANYLDLIPGTSNIFGITDAEECTCYFHSGIGVLGPHLWFHVDYGDKPDMKPTNIVFCGVAFFDGPMNWMNANFSVASSDDCLALLSQLGYTEGAPEDILEAYSKEYKLLTANCGFLHHTVRVLAHSAYRSDGIPPHFRHRTD